MAEGLHVVIVLALVIYLIIYAVVMYWAIKTEKGPFVEYMQPDPTDVEFYRIHGNVSDKPVVGSPCEDITDCTSGIRLTCDNSVCVSMLGGLCSTSSDCLDPNTCINETCS